MPPDPRQSLERSYVLSEADRAKFRELWLDHERRYGTPRRDKPPVELYDDAQSAPEFYVAKANSGIPALSGDTAGYSDDCTVHQLAGPDPDFPTLLPVPGSELGRRVYNLGGAVAAGAWVEVARDKYGRWWVISPGGGDKTFLAVLVQKHFVGNDHVVYSWAKVVDAPPWGYVEACPYVRGCPSHTPAYSSAKADFAVVGPAAHSSGTGTSHCYTRDALHCPGPRFIHPWSVVRLRRYGPQDTNYRTGTFTDTGTGSREGGYCLFGGSPRIDAYRRTGVYDDFGEIAYRRRVNQESGAFEDGEEVRLVEYR